jgi:hypothetical protein
MKLLVGERLEGAGPEQQPGGYVVTSIVRETPWFALYAGKKIFYNFDFSAKRVRETDEVEWLDVLLRTNRYPILDDPTYVQQRRALARAEVRAILGNRHSNLWPEPLDLLEIENTRDPFTFSEDAVRAGEPIIVYTKPHGKMTPDWQQQILPVSSILSVLAELLEFMQQAHSEGLLLLGLGPASLLIDASDRIHFVGTEMVLSQQNTLLKESMPAALWRRLYPPERFARGYAAPECFDPVRRPDVRSDLYAWGTLAYSLLTGTDLSAIAQAQGRPWLTFQDTHWAALEKLLNQLPRNNLEAWAIQLGVDANALLSSWPRKFLAAFRLLLHDDPARRPASVRELLAALLDPPPPPVAGFIALHTDADTAKLLLDCTGVEMDLEMTIQCGRGAPPAKPNDGWTIADGPIRPIVALNQLPMTTEPIYYTAFTRRNSNGDSVYSAGVSTQLWQPTQANLRQWAEPFAAETLDATHIPTRVGMVIGGLDLGLVADSLLASSLPRVRSWALRRIEQVTRATGFTTFNEALIWRTLADPNVENRQSAATMLWTLHPHKTDALLQRLIEALEAPPIEAPIAVQHFLRHLQIPEDRIQTAIQRFEAQRPAECPLCGKLLAHGERAEHLQSEHGYLVYDGDLLPAETVTVRLWDRVFAQLDRAAHEALLERYRHAAGVNGNPDAAIDRYLDALQRYLLGRNYTTVAGETVPIALPFSFVLAYLANLRHSASFLLIVRKLLRSPHRRMRDIAVQAVLPFVQEQLGVNPSLATLRRHLQNLCPDPMQTDTQIEICKQLTSIGYDAAFVAGCVVQLQDERLVHCPECQAQVQTGDLDLHLRRAHQVYQFRGVRGSPVETRDAIVKAVCTAPADMAAWKSLTSLAADRHAEDAERYVIAWIYQHLRSVEVAKRDAALAAVADVTIAAGAVDRLLPLYLGESKNVSWGLLGQTIALETCARMPPPIAPKVRTSMLPLLDQKELPRRTRENAAMALLRASSKEARVAADLLRAYVAHSSKKRGIEKLEHLEQRFGHSPAIDLVARELDNEIRMSCPRCPTELRKIDMVAHLWDKHRLLLDGERVREPWRVIEDWVVDYGLEKDPQVLLRCRELAQRDDPKNGLARLQQVLYRRGLRDRELLNELRAHVRTLNASLCPHCCTPVLMPVPNVIAPLKMEESSLEGHGYFLEVSEQWFIPTLRIESPDAVLFRGREPGRGLTRLGGIVLLAAPLLGVTYALLDWFTGHAYAEFLIGTMALGAGLMGIGMVFLLWPNPRPAKERLVKAAWRILVPRMLRGDMGGAQWAFLHGLIQLTDDVRAFAINQDLLLECAEDASEAAKTDVTAQSCLAVLSRRCLADMRAAKEEPFDYVVTLARECYQGRLPLSFLSDLLENFHGKERTAWRNSDLNRLVILLADAAFAAEVDLDDWLSLGRAFPVLNAVLNLDSRWHWLQFMTIRAERGRRPWEKAGPAVTMLDLVKDPAKYEDVLAFYPDALLYVPSSNLVIGSKGIWIEGICVTTFTRDTDFCVDRGSDGFELGIGDLTIRCGTNPRPRLDEIKRWLRYWFLEFIPSLPSVARPMTESRHRMWHLSKMTCSECHRPLVPSPGDLGVALK